MIGMPKFSYEKAYEQPLVVLIQAADLMAVKIEDAIDYKNLAK